MKLLIKLCILALVLSACNQAVPIATPTLPTSVSQEYQDFSYEMVWSPDDAMIALTTATGLYIYDTKTYKQLAAFDDLAGSTVAFSDQYLSAINHDGVFVWSLKDFSLLFKQATQGKFYFQSVAISPDNTILVTAESKQFQFWSLPKGELIADIPSSNFISDMVFSATDRLIVADTFLGTVQEWDTQSQKQIRAFGLSKPVVDLNLSQNGGMVIVDYGDNGFESWNVNTGKLDHKYSDIISAPGWNNISSDYHTVVVWGYSVGGKSGLSVWNLTTDKQLSEWSTPLTNGDGWRCGALNSDGSILAASTNEGFIYFYDVKNNEEIGKIFLPYKFIG